jgi:amino acid adenylation domain-containing protein
VTLFMSLLAGFQLLLARYSGEERIAVGSPIAGRNWKEVEGLIGFFVNMLVLVMDVSGNPTVRELMGEVRETAIGAYSHQDLPFEKLVEELQPERSLRQPPLFQVTFAFQSYPEETLAISNLKIIEEGVGVESTNFDLALTVAESGGRITGSVAYARDLYERESILRLLGHLRRLLEGISANQEWRVMDIPLLTEEEWEQVREWNRTAVESGEGKWVHEMFEEQADLVPDRVAGIADYPQYFCIHELIEARVAQTPNAIAVVYGNEQLSYEEMDRRANQLAHYLKKLGIRAESLVGILVERSFEMAFGFLGVLKAGGAYVPLDPSYPKERLATIVNDAGVSTVLTQHRLLKMLPDHGVSAICLDADWAEISQENEENLARAVHPENPAYAIYTSGSTGRPKGVLITHAALVNYTIDIVKKFRLQAGDKILQFASIGFDVVIEELFPAWLCGATVVLREGDLLDHSTALLQLIEKEGLTAFELPTAYWHEWVRQISHLEMPFPASLRFLVIGGERLSQERLAAWLKFGIPLIHVYGLTETTVTSTLYQQQGAVGDKDAPSELPIGRPIANTQIYLLDPRLKPVPIGVAGEIYIGGEGLARGYLNRPDLTGRRFIPNPFSNQPSARLYQTGDMARYLPDGNLEFLGRLDNQVKIRGFRIELGEIEVALRAQAGVAEAIVIAREDESSNKRLVAYLVAEPGASIETAELRHRLKERLPDYMIPAVFMTLESLPLTPNGKIDRRALPLPDRSRPEIGDAFIAPRNRVEEVLADIWAEVLGLERVGIRDGFFALGGHSLLVTQVVSRVREAFYIDLPLRSIFEMPTVASLAVAVIQLQLEQQDAAEVAQILRELENLSDDQPHSMLAE